MTIHPLHGARPALRAPSSPSRGRWIATRSLAFALVAVSVHVLAGCGPSTSSMRTEIDAWTQKTRTRHGGIPLEAMPRSSWRPLDVVNYQLGSGDAIDIRVLGHDELSFSELRVPPGGTIPFPLIGQIQAKGKTSTELALALQRDLTPHLREPKVLVTVNTYSRHVVSVIGSVRNSGVYPIQTGSRLLDVIVAAGGITLGGSTGGLAAGREMFIYRRRDSSGRAGLDPRDLSRLAQMKPDDLAAATEALAEQESYMTIALPVRDAVFQGNFEYNVLMQPDDIIYIPPAGSAIVMGWVVRPGLVSLGPSVHTLNHVLTMAGALRFGARSNVLIERDNGPNKPKDTLLVDAREIWSRDLPDVPLRDGDQIYVRRHPVRVVFEWLGGILNRGTQAGAALTYTPI